MPGRANVHVVLCLGLVVYLAACAEAPQPLRPGEVVSERPGQGVIFGRVAVIRDGEDRMMSLPSFPRSFGWELVQADTDKKFVVDPLTEDGLFALPLPTGLYHVTRLRYEDQYGVWEGSVPASFSVKDGWTYVGTWELTYAGLGSAVPITAATHDDLKDERAEFEMRYGISAHSIKVGLLQSAATGHLSLLRPRSEQ